MPKQKTHKSTVKRIKITATGKILRLYQSAQHRTKGKSKRSLANAMKSQTVSPTDLKRFKKII